MRIKIRVPEDCISGATQSGNGRQRIDIAYEISLDSGLGKLLTIPFFFIFCLANLPILLLGTIQINIRTAKDELVPLHDYLSALGKHTKPMDRESSLSSLRLSASSLAKEAKISPGNPESEAREVKAVYVNETVTVLVRQSSYSSLRPALGVQDTSGCADRGGGVRMSDSRFHDGVRGAEC